MSLKMKLVSMVSAFVLVIGMLLIGVFAVERVQVDMGGSITFNADDVYARVTGSVEKAQVAPNNLDVTYSATGTTGNPEAWESLDLEFDSYATPILISITVENLSTERSLTVNLTDALASSVPNLGKELKRDNSAYTSGTNILLDPKDNGTSTTTFTITLSVTDKNQSLTNAQFDYDLNLYDESAVPEPPEVYDLSEFEFNFLENNTVEIAKYNGTASEVVIPATFSIGTIPITSFTVNEDGSSDVGDYAMMALYLGGFYYTPQGGERTYCANFMEFASIADTLAFPIYFEPQYTLSLDAYNENNLQLFANYIETLAGMQEAGYSDGKFYFTTADGEYNNTLVNAIDLMNSLSTSVQDPTELQPMFPMQLNLASTFKAPITIEGNDYTVVSIVDGYYDANHPLTGSTGAFAKNTTITSVVLPDTIEYIGECAFYYSTSLASITLPEGLTSIGYRAFQSCSGLTSVDLSGCTSLASIGEMAFSGCSGLTSISLPSSLTSLTSIGYDAFYGCSGLESITVEEGNPVYHSEGNCLIETESNTLVLGCKNSVIPSYITSIGYGAFQDCSGLTTVDLSQCTSLTSIGYYAFYGCSGLTSISLPTSITSIGSNAFYGCRGLKEVIIDSEYVYTNAKSASACGSLFNNSSITTVKVLTSLVEENVENSYITTNFPNVSTEMIEGKSYTVYSKN